MHQPALWLAFALALVFAAASVRFARTISGARHALLSFLAFAALMIASVALFYVASLHLITFYIMVLASSLIAIGLLGGPSMRSIMAASIVALCFMLANGLLCYGYLNIIGYAEASTYAAAASGGFSNETQGANRLLLISAAQGLAALSVWGQGRILGKAFPASKRADRALRPFFAFTCFAIAYTVLDTIPFALNTWFEDMPLFLFGGTALLAVFCVVFSAVTSSLGAEAFRESENIVLERKRTEQESRLRLTRLQATTDTLTGLATRRVGQKRLDELDAQRTGYTVAFIDLNGLKNVNDHYGHAAGDAYLVSFARALENALPHRLIVRWGGDEFLAIAEDTPSETATQKLSDELASVQASAHVGNTEMPVRFCYGLASWDPGSSAGTVLRRADDAMYAAKRTALKENACGYAAGLSAVCGRSPLEGGSL